VWLANAGDGNDCQSSVASSNKILSFFLEQF